MESVLGGRYELMRLLGRGGMGEVYLARDVELERPVAVKLMNLHPLVREEDFRRFQQEMQIAAQMQHPNIVTLFTSGAENGIPFMVMEYLHGNDLTHMPPVWESGEVARVGRAVCEALAYAHELGVVHRDIKPGNLFMCQSRLVKVTDFGIAKALTPSNAARPGTVIGTPPYMAPEQWLRRPRTFASDIWATAVVMYELLTGTLPWECDHPEEYAAAACSGHASPLACSAALPSWLADSIMAMLAPDPASRPTATECVKMLSGPPQIRLGA